MVSLPGIAAAAEGASDVEQATHPAGVEETRRSLIVRVGMST